MDITEKVLDLAIQIQQIPAPTFAEQQRAVFLRDCFASEGLREVTVDALANVYACWPGAGGARPLVISAHSDTVFPHDTNLAFTRTTDTIHGPGIGDNSLGVAGLFGALWSLRQRGFSPPGDLWLVANVCEEGLGDLKGMRAVVERFGDQPLAYLVVEGMALGQIYHQGLGVQRYRITAHTRGGHSWVDYGSPSAIHELAALLTRLDALPLPEKPRTTLNVGVISGGMSVNTIAPAASLDLDLRSAGKESLQKLIEQVETLVAESCRAGVHCEAEIIGQRPAGEIPAAHPLVRLAEQTLEAQGLTPQKNIGSTDANIPLSRGLPCVCIGITTGSGAHTLQEYIHTRPVAQGLAQLAAVITGAYDQLA